MNRKERKEFWRLTLEAYRKAKAECDSVDPESEKYSVVKENYNAVLDKIGKMAQEDKKMFWDMVKFWVSTGLGTVQMVLSIIFSVVMLDWEQANSMRSKLWPTVQQWLPKAWRYTIPKD